MFEAEIKSGLEMDKSWRSRNKDCQRSLFVSVSTTMKELEVIQQR